MKSVFFEATRRSLKQNKLRTTATLIGVIVSVAMITGVLCMSSSIKTFLENRVKDSYGNWSVSVENMSNDMRKEAEEQNLVFGTAEAVGYSYIENSANPQKPFLFLENIDRNLAAISNLKVVEGRMPGNDKELMLPEHLITNAGIKYKIGDEITLSLGERIDIHQGNDMGQEDPYDPQSEAFVSREQRTYTVVGICERLAVEPYMAAGYTAITYGNEQVMNGATTYFSDENYGKTEFLIEEHYPDKEGVKYNKELLSITGDIIDIKQMGLMFVFTMLLLAVIVFGSYMLMYNTFAISVREKRKQYEIFASVGATENQLRRITVYEGIFYGLVSIPTGILLGIGGAFFVMSVFGEKMAAIVTSDTNVSPAFSIDAGTVILALIISFIAVYISITVPAYKAGQTKPIKASGRSRKEDAERKERNRATKFLMKIGGVEMLLADRNFHRNSKNYRNTIVSVVMSIVLFVTAGAVSVYMENGITAELGSNEGYDISYISDDGADAEAAYMVLSNTDGVTESSYVMCGTLSISLGNSPFEYSMYIVDDHTFAKYLREADIEPIGYFDESSPKAIATSSVNVYDSRAGRIREKEIFKEGERPYALRGIIGGEYFITDIGKYTRNMPEELIDSVGRPVIMISKSASKNILSEVESGVFEGRAVFRSDNPDKTYAAMSKLCRDNGMAEDNLANLQAARDEAGSLLTLIKIFSFGFIILISIIALANLFNTVAANIDIRRIEFASLSSLGMTQESLKKMIYFEGIILGVRMLLYSIPLSLVGLVFAFCITNYGSHITGYIFPWGSFLISFAILAAMIFAIIKYTYYKAGQEEASYIFKNQNYYR